MLESILTEELASQGPWRMFFLAIAIGAVSIALATVLGAGEDTSHLMVAFACIALVLTLPLYPLIMLAVVIEDGWPIFFLHRRETIGGSEVQSICKAK